MSRRIVALMLAPLILSGCGPSLGDYEVVDVRLVDVVPETEGFPMPGRGEAFGPFLRIDLRSDFDLVVDGIGDTYAFKIDCGLFGEEQRMIFGPFAASDPPTDLFDVQPAMQRGADGKVAYLLYSPVSADPRVGYSGADPQPGYDMLREDGDLCLKIMQTGYFITESRSDTIRIPAETFTKVLGR